MATAIKSKPSYKSIILEPSTIKPNIEALTQFNNKNKEILNKIGCSFEDN
jgi:hypothetical protein